MDAIADFSRRRHTSEPVLDDRTWHDLLLDEVFARLDRTESRIGQQMLYHRLRTATVPRALDAFDALARAADNPQRRERAQEALARLSTKAAYYVHHLTWPDALTISPWHRIFPLWTAAVVLTLVLALIWPGLLYAVALGFAVNRVILVAVGRRFRDQMTHFRQVGPLLSSARTLTVFATSDTDAITGSLRSDLAALAKLGTIARWVSRDPLTTDELTYLALEFVNGLLLLDANALYLAGPELQKRAPHLARVIETVGTVDAAISVASFRAETGGWVRPHFLPPRARAALSELRHPLVDAPVPNSLTLAPPHGVLVTGSNMSGKSTLLRTLGVNVILAQAIDTCLASAYEAPVYTVKTCLGRSDDLLAGKSYYLVEVESVLALVQASERTEPHLFLFDELFRGTNAVERIAGGVAILSAVVGPDRPHVVVAATHDSELVEELSHDGFMVTHLGDAVGPNGLVFDYRLVSGAATSRNAITLLELSGAPRHVVQRALTLAMDLDRRRQRMRDES
jgi:hypothetical protein